MTHWTLRARLTLWSAFLFAAAVVLLGVLTVSLVRRHQIESLDAELVGEMRSFFHELGEHGPAGYTHAVLEIDKDTHVVLLDAAGKQIWASPELGGEVFGSARQGAQTIRGRRVLVSSENGYTVRLARDFRTVDATVADVRRAYLFSLPILLALIAAGVWLLVRSALRPVHEIASTAQKITAERLNERLDVPLRQDEIGQLTSVLNEMLDRLDRGFRQAVRFTADASHELKTPLALIGAGLEELLRRRDLAPDVVEALASLLEDNRRLSAVCQDLLVLARADAGRLALDRQAHDLRALVDAALDDAHILAEERSIRFDVVLPVQAFECVDARYFTQILLNLLSNAVKYNHANGIVRLGLSQDADYWVLSVSNTGPGIPSEYQPRLFERFFRADSSAAIPGHGLGLSLSRELARAHGGELWLKHSGTDWTTFCVKLPRNPASLPAPVTAPARENPASPVASSVPSLPRA